MALAATSTRTSSPQPIPLDTLLRGSSSSSRTSLGSTRPSITFTVSPPETGLTLSPSTHGTLPRTLLPSSPSTPIAASPYSSTRRIASSAAAPICPTPGQPNISTQEVDSVGWRLRKWLHIRTWWQGSFAVITLVIGVLGLVYSAYRTYNLARWTAAKDFYEQCHNAKVEKNFVSQECANALSLGLAPPPYGYNDFLTNLTKRFHDGGYRTNQISSPPHSVPVLADVWASESYALFTPGAAPSQVDLWWPIKFLLVLVPVLAGGAILLFMYRRLTEPIKVESSPVRSIKPIKITRLSQESQYAGLRRRRPGITNSKDSDLNVQDYNTSEWHGDCSTGSENMDGYVIEQSTTASVQQVEYDPDNQDSKLPSTWHIPEEEQQKNIKWSHFRLFFHFLKKRPPKPPGMTDFTDVLSRRMVSDPHGTRGHGVFDLERLKPNLPSPPGQHQPIPEHDLSCDFKPTTAATGVILADRTDTGHSAPEHAVGSFHLAPACEDQVDSCKALPGQNLMPNREDAVNLALRS